MKKAITFAFLTEEKKPMKSTISKISKALGALALVLTITTNLGLAAYPPASVSAAQWWQWALAEPAPQTIQSWTPPANLRL